ncbi:hypothetical protein LzC2_32440 [Planctomycetes bacterium LzC2]|uniref:DUF4235 domain-containing protein n=2 Tax=Alienimonas chondri TaxID=2681879 RepID=A0ABX1VG91_9PLAN|nr:hypothetical protein [Alienimonas chondri]
MEAVRGRVDRHAADFSEAARRSGDWTCYVRSAPLACAAAAAAVGYLAVPARPRSPKVVRTKGKRRSSDSEAASPKEVVERPVSGKGPWMGLAAVIGNVAVRAGTAYLSQKAGSMFGAAAADADSPSAGPTERPPGEARGPGASRNADRPFGSPR